MVTRTRIAAVRFRRQKRDGETQKQTPCDHALGEREVVLKVENDSPLSQAHVDNEARLLTIDMKNSVV